MKSGRKAIEIVVLMLLGACAASLEEPERFGEPRGEAGGADGGLACHSEIFLYSCGASGCHSGASAAAALDLTVSDAEGALLDVPASCGDRPLIASGGTEHYLLEKLGNSPECGAPMPPGGPLSAAEIDCLTAWAESVSGAGR